MSEEFDSTKLFGKIAFPMLAAIVVAFLVGDWWIGIGLVLGIGGGLYCVLIMFNSVEQGIIDKKYKDRNKQEPGDRHGNRRLHSSHLRRRRRR